MGDMHDAIADIGDGLVSWREADKEGNPANIVDGMFALARALTQLAKAIEGNPVAKRRRVAPPA